MVKSLLALFFKFKYRKSLTLYHSQYIVFLKYNGLINNVRHRRHIHEFIHDPLMIAHQVGVRLLILDEAYIILVLKQNI